MKTIWQLPKDVPQEMKKQFPEFHPIILSLLYQRGLTTQEQIDEFFNPDYSSDLHNPFLFKDMSKAVERIERARKEKEKVVVYGDFDVDGVTASVVLFKTLKKIGLNNLEIYIPSRENESHGLNKSALKMFSKKGVKLIITVDCGSYSNKEVEEGSKLGIDIIVTDHHRPEKKVNAFAFINPKYKAEKYPYRDLAGVGVSFKLAQALLSSKQGESYKAFEKWLLDLVALGTIADRMPLLGENRTLVKYGLLVLNKTSNLGLRALIKNLGLPLGSLKSDDVAFYLAPCLNSAGRVNHANDSLALLLSENKEQADKWALKLKETNNQRQKMLSKTIENLKKRKEELEQKWIFIITRNCPTGVAGLAASKIAKDYGKPTVIFLEKHLRGSARVEGDFDLFKSLAKFKKYFLDFGGHNRAAGFKLKDKIYLESLKKGLLEEAKSIKPEELLPKLFIDAIVDLEEIDWDLYNEVEKFEPFGEGNEMPNFLVRKVKLIDLETVGKQNNHCRLYFKGGKKMIYFFVDEETEEKKLKKGENYDIVFCLGINQWNGQQELQLKVVDLRKS